MTRGLVKRCRGINWSMPGRMSSPAIQIDLPAHSPGHLLSPGHGWFWPPCGVVALVPRSSERPAASRDHWAVGRPSVRNCSPLFLPSVAASQRASLPRSPADRTRSCPTARSWEPSPPRRDRWSSRSRTRGRRAAGSRPACRTTPGEQGVGGVLRPSTTERPSP